MKGQRLTLRPLFVEASPTNNLCLNHHIAAHTSLRDKLLRPTIIPRIPTERLPDSQHGAIGSDIDAVRRKDELPGPDIEQIGRGGVGTGKAQILEDEGRRASHRSGQDMALPLDILRALIFRGGRYGLWRRKSCESGVCGGWKQRMRIREDVGRRDRDCYGRGRHR